MTKEEYTQAKERALKYQNLDFEFGKIDSALKHIKAYDSFTMNTSTSGGNIMITMSAAIREDMIALLQHRRDYLAEQMEEV